MGLLGKLLRVLVVLLLGAGVLYLASPAVLGGIGRYLITSHPLEKSDVAVVMAGAPFLRAPEAARLFHDGLAARILLTNAAKPPGLDALRGIGLRYPDDQELALAILEGLRVPRAAVDALSERVDGTREEVAVLGQHLGRPGVRSVIVVTSKSRSTRSDKWLREALPAEVTLRMHPVPTDPFDPRRWWKTHAHVREVVQEYLGLADYWWVRAWGALGGARLPVIGPVKVVRAEG